VSLSPGRWAGTWGPSAWRRFRVRPVSWRGWSLAGLHLRGGVGLDGRAGRPGLMAFVPGGLLVVQELEGQLVVGAGVLEAELAGVAGLVRAVRACPVLGGGGWRIVHRHADRLRPREDPAS
jgi:hypothetical protein